MTRTIQMGLATDIALKQAINAGLLLFAPAFEALLVTRPTAAPANDVKLIAAMNLAR